MFNIEPQACKMVCLAEKKGGKKMVENNGLSKSQIKYRKNPERYKAAVRRYRMKNPEYEKLKQRKWHIKNPLYATTSQKYWKAKNVAKYMLNGCRGRAVKNGREFSLTLEWLEKKLSIGTCERTNLPFVFVIGTTEKKFGRHPHFPSIDRINSSLGYTEANCQVVCAIYNLAKQDWSDYDVLNMAKALIKKLNDEDPLS